MKRPVLLALFAASVCLPFAACTTTGSSEPTSATEEATERRVDHQLDHIRKVQRKRARQ